MNGLYIHIPFCISRCNYCDFVSYAGKEDLIDTYIEYLYKEAFLYKNIFEINTVYLGGGTPSLLNEKQIQHIGKIVDIFSSNPIEFTIEANPESLTEKKLIRYREIGVNRLSLGLQSTHDEILKLLSRHYSFKNFIEIYDKCRKHFDNINIDLMYGLPNQKFDDFIKDVKNATQLHPEHISIYELHLKETNPLYKLLPTEEERADMYEYLLNKNDEYIQYEISNWSKNGFESKHNIIYWKNENYIGLGLAAGGHINEIRYINTNKFSEYFKLIEENKKPISFYQNNLEAYIKESIIMNLRLMKGLNIEKFNKKFNKNFTNDYRDTIQELIKLKLCSIEKGFFKLTKTGIMLANRVFEYFV